jgi:hypothetical protein
LTNLVAPFAVVDPARHIWMPQGLSAPAEAKLGEALGFLSPDQRGSITDWWLARTPNANTPNWDLAATATVGGQEGLVLVEAKAHAKELSANGKTGGGHPANDASIRRAIAEANAGLDAAIPGWSLSRDACYQMANRFAWSWKLATMGVPVVLVYLGFLGAEEMQGYGPLLTDPQSWEWLVKTHARGHVPEGAWGTRLRVGEASLTPLIRSVPSIPL